MIATLPRPLEINVPRLSGREVPAGAGSVPAPRSIPVVGLATSAAAEAVPRSHDPHANRSVTTPVALDDSASVLRRVEGFRTHVVRLPTV